MATANPFPAAESTHRQKKLGVSEGMVSSGICPRKPRCCFGMPQFFGHLIFQNAQARKPRLFSSKKIHHGVRK